MALSVLSAGAVPPNPQELLGRPMFADWLQRVASEYDMVLIDTPAAAEFADAQTIASRVRLASAVSWQVANSPGLRLFFLAFLVFYVVF